MIELAFSHQGYGLLVWEPVRIESVREVIEVAAANAPRNVWCDSLELAIVFWKLATVLKAFDGRTDGF